MSVCFCSESVARALVALSDAGAPSNHETMPAFVMPSDREVMSALTRLVRAVDDPLDRQILAPLVMQELLYRLLRSDAAAAVRSAVAREPDAPIDPRCDAVHSSREQEAAHRRGRDGGAPLSRTITRRGSARSPR